MKERWNKDVIATLGTWISLNMLRYLENPLFMGADRSGQLRNPVSKNTQING